MRHIIVTFFCTFLSSGNLQTIDNENNYHYQPEPAVMEPVYEYKIVPVQSYQTFRGNFYARKSINPNCVKPGDSQNVNSHETELLALERPMKNQLVPSPTRRTSYMEPKQKTLNNMESTNLQPKLTNDLPATVIQTQPLKSYPTALRSQPQDLKEVEPTAPRIKTTTVQDEESETLRSTNELSSALRSQPEIIKDEVSNAQKNLPKNINNGESNTFRTDTKVEPNMLRSQPEAPENEESHKFRKQPPISKEEVPCTSRTETQVQTNDNSNVLRSSSDVFADSQNLASASNEKTTDDNSLVSISEEHNEVDGSQNSGKSEPYTVERVESYSIELTTEHLVSPSFPLDSHRVMSKIHCSDENNGAVLNPERRVLMNAKDSESKWIPAVDRNEFLALNNINPPETSVLGTKTKPVNQASGVSSQNENISALNTKRNEIKSNEIVPEKSAVSSSNETPLKKPAQRAGKVQFFAEATNNEIKDPTKGQGISYIKKTTLMLMDYDRVCYACSTANSPTCLFPDRRTGVKYCRKGDNACVTKTFGSGSTLTLIRDCAKSCDDSEPGFAPNYKSCGICYTDLCNSAYSIKINNLILTLPSLVILVLVKQLL